MLANAMQYARMRILNRVFSCISWGAAWGIAVFLGSQSEQETCLAPVSTHASPQEI